jgi:hypothetical protein
MNKFRILVLDLRVLVPGTRYIFLEGSDEYLGNFVKKKLNDIYVFEDSITGKEKIFTHVKNPRVYEYRIPEGLKTIEDFRCEWEKSSILKNKMKKLSSEHYNSIQKNKQYNSIRDHIREGGLTSKVVYGKLSILPYSFIQKWQKMKEEINRKNRDFPISVYRALKWNELLDYKTGDSIHHPIPFSATTNLDFAAFWMFSLECCILKINIPTYIDVTFFDEMKENTDHTYQAEIIIPQGNLLIKHRGWIDTKFGRKILYECEFKSQ